MSSHIVHDFRVSNSVEELAQAAAVDFAERAHEAVLKKGSFSVALSGGNTPKVLFDTLAIGPDFGHRAPIPWPRIHIFWGDERYVPHNDPQSNFLMTRDHLLDKVPIPPENIHPIPTDSDDPNVAAQHYENILRAEFQLQKKSAIPEFDLVYLGLGPDGHTASLFPNTELVKKIIDGEIPSHQLVAALKVEKFKMHRITLLPAIINAARCVSFLVAGDDKAAMVNMVVEGKRNPLVYPSQLIIPQNGKLLWFVDKAAMKLVDQSGQ